MNKKEIRVDIYIDGKSSCDYVESSKMNTLLTQLEQNSIKITYEPKEKNMLAFVNGDFYQYTKKSPFVLFLLSSSLENANTLMRRNILKHKTLFKYHIEFSMLLGATSLILALFHPCPQNLAYAFFLFLLQGYFLYLF